MYYLPRRCPLLLVPTNRFLTMFMSQLVLIKFENARIFYRQKALLGAFYGLLFVSMCTSKSKLENTS